ncbi:hypothetical protein wTkk_000746 [Wolbachia endosymbiont of Trichogramma kaykai]
MQSGNAECIEFFIDNQVQFLKNKYNDNPFNPSGSTSREECGNNHSVERHVSYGSANNSVSDKEVSKSPSLILSNFEEGGLLLTILNSKDIDQGYIQVHLV